jgi:hypothetical protein
VSGACGCGHPDQTFCSATSTIINNCVNLGSEVASCGSCGHVCSNGNWCNGQGRCAKSCATGFTHCNSASSGGECADLNNDSANCGMCGRECPNGAACQLAVCVCPASQSVCPVSGSKTGMLTCAETMTDPQNCGGCGVVCVGGTGCVAGQCVCPSGEVPCGGVCVNTVTDPEHCGACGSPCGSGHCSGGMCVDCPSGRVACDGVCVDETTDPDNCGACGAGCPNGTCASGACSCASASTWCTDLGCGATSYSEANCGTAGVVCATGEVCAGAGAACQTPSRPIQLTTQPGDRAMASDGQNLFFIASTDELDELPVTGGPLQTIAPSIVLALTADSTSVYWSNNAFELWRAPLTGGTPIRLATAAPGNNSYNNLAVDGGVLYAAETLTLPLAAVTRLLAGATTTTALWQTIETNGENVPLAAFNGVVYWIDRSGRLFMAPGDGSGWPTAVDPAGPAVAALAVGATGLYYTRPSTGEIVHAPPGGGPPVIIAAGQADPSLLAVDDAALYWFNSGDGTVRKQSLCGGVQITLAQGAAAAALTIDATNIYWAGLNGVWVTPK